MGCAIRARRVIETERLVLRRWQADDAAWHNALCNDPRVRATLGAAPTLADSADVIVRQNGYQESHGFCFWALEPRTLGHMAGWCGLKPGTPPIEGETEIGWTIAPDLWGQGLAREAAEAVLAWAWRNTACPSIVAITTPGNTRSRALMQRIGMRHDPARDFDHPALSADDPLRRHVLYRIQRP